MKWKLSFRTRILFIVLALGSIPPLVLGLWLTRSTAGSAEEIVQSRLGSAIEQTVPAMLSRWIVMRSAMLDLADRGDIRRLLDAPGPGDSTSASVSVGSLPFEPIEVRLRDDRNRVVWQVRSGGGRRSIGLEAPDPPVLPVSFGIHDVESGAVLGHLEVALTASALLPDGAAPEGLLVGLFYADDGTSLIPRPFDRVLAREDRMEWGGEEWRVARHALEEPPVVLALAAPENPFGDLLMQKARTGVWVLLGVSTVGLLLAVASTVRLTRSLDGLASAVEAVSLGDLDRTVDRSGPPEIGRIAAAFNEMTASLRRTLARLASQQSLAAVGEFAASIAHEVRNPLTAIRIDLERVEESLPDDSPLRPPQERALREIRRLDATVSEALHGARGGASRLGVVDLGEPLRAAAEAVQPDIDSKSGSLDLRLPDFPIEIRGDAGALEQLLLNLLRNAAQALGSGGSVTIRVQSHDGSVALEVRDDGSGIPADALDRVFEPMFTTRPDGTGLGLTIARRIAIAHGGQLELESARGQGTTARLTLPLERAQQR